MSRYHSKATWKASAVRESSISLPNLASLVCSTARFGLRGWGGGGGNDTGAAGTGTGVWSGEGWMGVGASTHWTIGAGCVGAGASVRMSAGTGGSYICESGRDGMFRFGYSSLSEPSGSGSSWEVIPPSSSHSGPSWCERMVPTPPV